jgi:paraquat-inducible protein B
LQQIYDKISQLPLDELVEDTRTLIKGANRVINDPMVAQAVANASQAMTDLQQAARTLEGRIGPVISSIETTSDTANRTLKSAQEAIAGTDDVLQAAQQALVQADRTLKTANSVIQPGGPVNYELINALKETAAAARSLRELADQLQRSPNSLLFGRPAGASR